jgi:hypothetical protein
MGRITRAVPHLPVKTVKAKFVAAPNPTQRRRWAMVYNALVEPERPGNHRAACRAQAGPLLDRTRVPVTDVIEISCQMGSVPSPTPAVLDRDRLRSPR